MPAREVEPLYDDDGNLLLDGRWTYTWDGENRLVEMEAVAEGRRVAFDYDGQSRRVRKRVWLNEVLETDVRYVYDGWNMAYDFNVTSNPTQVRRYVWGLDLSGSLQGAGGVGGLLAILEGADVYTPAYDGNGNITLLVATEDASVVAIYEYDPFGNLLRQTGPYAAANPYRFSTKYTDDETGLLYYGYRYYSPQLGLWMNRDPADELGVDTEERNLYAFSENAAQDDFDYLGLMAWRRNQRLPRVVFRQAVGPRLGPGWSGRYGQPRRLASGSFAKTRSTATYSVRVRQTRWGQQACNSIVHDDTADGGTVFAGLKSGAPGEYAVTFEARIDASAKADSCACNVGAYAWVDTDGYRLGDALIDPVRGLNTFPINTGIVVIGVQHSGRGPTWFVTLGQTMAVNNPGEVQVQGRIEVRNVSKL